MIILCAVVRDGNGNAHSSCPAFVWTGRGQPRSFCLVCCAAGQRGDGGISLHWWFGFKWRALQGWHWEGDSSPEKSWAYFHQVLQTVMSHGQGAEARDRKVVTWRGQAARIKQLSFCCCWWELSTGGYKIKQLHLLLWYAGHQTA